MSNAGRSISLTERHRRFVDAQVATGRHASASELVREVLRRCEDDVAADQAHLDMLRALAAQSETDIARGATIKIRSSAHLRAILDEASHEADAYLAAEAVSEPAAE